MNHNIDTCIFPMVLDGPFEIVVQSPQGGLDPQVENH